MSTEDFVIEDHFPFDGPHPTAPRRTDMANAKQEQEQFDAWVVDQVAGAIYGHMYRTGASFDHAVQWARRVNDSVEWTFDRELNDGTEWFERHQNMSLSDDAFDRAVEQARTLASS